MHKYFLFKFYRADLGFFKGISSGRMLGGAPPDSGKVLILQLYV